MPPEPGNTPSLSPVHIVTLRQSLGSTADEIIPALQTILAAFPDATSNATTEKIRRQLERHIGPLMSLVAAMQAVLDDLKSVPADEQPAWHANLERLFVEVVMHVGILDYVLAYPRSRGRPRDEARRWLSNNVAYILRRSGIALKKTHGDGTHADVFYSVLALVIEVAEGQDPPGDLFALIRETVDLLGHFTQEQLDAIDPVLIGFLRVPR